VRKFVETHGVEDKWVAVDDMDLRDGLGEDNFVYVDSSSGLTEENVERIVEILGTRKIPPNVG